MSWLSKLFGRRRSTVKRPAMAREDRTQSVDPMSIRRWDGAATTRLNRDHWRPATGNPINEDLLSDLPTLRARCTYEASSNPIIAGMLETFATDVVGRCGPSLQVESDDEQFNAAVETMVKELFESPDPDCPMSIVETARLWIRSLCTSGDYVVQEFTADRSGSMPFTLGMRTIESCRLDTPTGEGGNQQIFFGVEVNDDGKPIRYWVRNRDVGMRFSDRYKWEPVPPDFLHVNYQFLEPGQLRGVPWLAPSLNVIQELREYDRTVLDSATNAARNAVVAQANSPDIELDQDVIPVEQEIQRGVINYMTPGWQAMAVDATQPTAQYKDFRHERLREFGRPFGMPLMMIILSSADSNFASAHYDGQVYIRFVQYVQDWITRTTLKTFVKKGIRELELARVLRVPSFYRCNWTWPVPPPADPKKHAEAVRMQLEDGLISYSEALGIFGRDEETVIAQRQRTAERLAEAGLPPVPSNIGSGGVAQLQADTAAEPAGVEV